MRALALASALAVLLVVVVPLAEGHEENIHHGQLFAGALLPGEQVTKELEFEGGPLLGGWVFLLGAKVQGGSLDATVRIGNSVAGSWTIPETSRWVVTTVLPETGVYDLTVENSGTADVTYAIYFDQSCNCAGKFIFPEIPDGMIIFNTDASGPSTVFAQFNEPKAMTLRITAALLASPGGVWPSDFQTLAVSEAPVQRSAGPDLPPLLVHELRFSVSKATRVYFFLEGVSFDSEAYGTPADLLVTPFYDVKPTATAASSSPWIYAGIAAAFVGAGALILWRGRRRPQPRQSPKSRPKPGVSRGGGRGERRRRTSRGRRRRR